jgi:hypothetical protein
MYYTLTWFSYISIGSAISARKEKERWNFVDSTAGKMVKLQNYDQAPR